MEVAIIGAGTIGLYLALKLFEKGYQISLFEKRKRIGKETCSGLFSERIFDFIPESRSLIKNKIDFCLIHFPYKTIKVNFQKKFFIIDHFELDNLIFSFLQKTKVKIFLNHKIEKIPEGFNKIIGCDGSDSVIRKILKLPQPTFYLGIQGFLNQSDFSNAVETWPTKNGFIWKIPRGEETEYGIMEKPKEAKKILYQFLKKRNQELENIKSALIPQGLIIPKNKNITLCGDALGLTKPWSGGGVVWGLKAAEILLKNFPNFQNYHRELKKFFFFEIFSAKIIKKLVYFFGFRLPWFLPKKVKIDGDFLGKGINL